MLSSLQKMASLPVTLEIRKTVNGYAGSEILKGSRVTLNPDKVNLPSSENALNARLIFDKPVFLEPDEYAIVLLTNSSEYRAFMATVGESRVDTAAIGQTVTSRLYTDLYSNHRTHQHGNEINSLILAFCFV